MECRFHAKTGNDGEQIEYDARPSDSPPRFLAALTELRVEIVQPDRRNEQPNNPMPSFLVRRRPPDHRASDLSTFERNALPPH